MSANDAFFDTTIILYLLSADETRANRAEAVMAEGGVVSVQVLNELVSVCRRKLGLDFPAVAEILDSVKGVCRVNPVTIETHELGLALAQRYGFAIYDGTIIAAAQLAGCGTLYTEDLQHGQVIDGLSIRNPFASS